MKTLTKDRLSLYVFENEKPVFISESFIKVGDPEEMIIADCNNLNTVLHEGVTPPEDWTGCKYFYENGEWEQNPDWVSPEL
jgi:hypothetical protein